MPEEINNIKKQKIKALFNSKQIEALIFFIISILFSNMLGIGYAISIFVAEIATYCFYCPKYNISKKYDRYLDIVARYILPTILSVFFLFMAIYNIKTLLISIILTILLYINLHKMVTIWEWVVSLFVPFYLILFSEYLNGNFKNAFYSIFNINWTIVSENSTQIHFVYLFSYLIVWSLICLLGLFIKKRKLVYSLMGYFVFIFALLNKLSLIYLNKTISLSEIQTLLSTILQQGSKLLTENIGVWIVSIFLIIIYEVIINNVMKTEHVLSKNLRIVLAILGTCIIIGSLLYMKTYDFSQFNINSTLFNIVKSIY